LDRDSEIDTPAKLRSEEMLLLSSVGGEAMLATLDAATKSVAQGYTTAQSNPASSKQSFTDAVASLKTYMGQVKAKAASGQAAPETAALLIDFTNTLIERIAFEAKITDPLVTPGADGSTRVVEFYRSLSQQYFLGVDLGERATLDKGGAGGDWVRSGASFMAWVDQPSAPSNTVPVCRFYGVPVNGPTSHYFTASASECAALKTDPKWVYEGIAFRALSLVNGACPSGMVTVTRVSKTGTTPAAAGRPAARSPSPARW